MIKDDKIRCFGCSKGHELYAAYHDSEWGIPVYDDIRLFEMLVLEGAQAGLSFETILKRREGYREAFCQFDPYLVAQMTDQELDALMQNPAIIRNFRKIYSVRQNAIVFLDIQKEFGSFSQYFWGFSKGNILSSKYTVFSEVPAKNLISETLSKDLKKRGMNFVGPTIMYAYMQAVGMMDDHLISCWLRNLAK